MQKREKAVTFKGNPLTLVGPQLKVGDNAPNFACVTSGLEVIWTTTPWTLPANLGITLNEQFEYVALKAGEEYYIVASRLADDVEKACGVKAEKRIALSREALVAALRYYGGKPVELIESPQQALAGDQLSESPRLESCRFDLSRLAAK